MKKILSILILFIISSDVLSQRKNRKNNSKSNTQNWKYLEFNPQSMQLIASIIPVLDQLLLNETAVTE